MYKNKIKLKKKKQTGETLQDIRQAEACVCAITNPQIHKKESDSKETDKEHQQTESEAGINGQQAHFHKTNR